MTKNSQPLRQEGRNDFTAPSEPAFQLAVEDAPAALEALLFAAGDHNRQDPPITGLDRQTLSGCWVKWQRDMIVIEGEELCCEKRRKLVFLHQTGAGGCSPTAVSATTSSPAFTGGA